MKEQCQRIKKYIEDYFNPKYIPRLLYLDLPKTFEEYIDKIVKKSARTEWHKAKKNNCSLERIYDIIPINDDIIEIWESQKERKHTEKWRWEKQFLLEDLEGRLRWFLKKWPKQKYEYFCSNHKVEFWVVKKDSKVISYIEIVKANDKAVVHSTFGHTDYLKYGIMKFMFVELLRYYIEEKKIKIFSYGFEQFLKDNRRFFVEDLGIIKVWKNEKP